MVFTQKKNITKWKYIAKAAIESGCLLEQFKKAGSKSSNVKNFQFWRHDNQPIELSSNKIVFQKITKNVHN